MKKIVLVLMICVIINSGSQILNIVLDSIIYVSEVTLFYSKQSQNYDTERWGNLIEWINRKNTYFY